MILNVEEDRKRRFSSGSGRERVLSSWINEFKFTHIAELGVLDGFTAEEILNSCPSIIEYIGVDKFENPDEYDSLAPKGDESRNIYNSFDFNYFYNLTLKNLDSFKDKVKLVRRTTSEASVLYPDEYFDLVFIDADHSYEGVKEDITKWLPKVKCGGILSGHDFSWAGVRKAINECLPITNVSSHLDNVWRYDKD